MNRTTTRGFRVAFFHADMDEPQNDEKAQDQPRATYPKRPAYFAHKFVRRLTKSCAAMDIGPEACYLLTVIAFQEDSCRYQRAVMFWDGQLAGLVGAGTERTLSRYRDKAVAAGWLHYEPGRKRVPGRYWVTIPEHAEVFDDSPIGADDAICDDTNAEKPPRNCRTNRRETVAERAEKLSAQPPDNCRAFIPNPNPNPVPNPVGGDSCARNDDPGYDPSPPPDPADDIQTADHPNIDWLTVEREFLEVWNNSPETCDYRAMKNFQGRFRLLWMDTVWRANCYRAIARLSTTYWAGRNLSLGQFLKPEFCEEVLGGRYDDAGPRTTGKNGVGAEKPTPSHLTIGRRVERDDNGGY